MSDRERWIIYPLLFLALGSALVNKLMPQEARFARLECSELQVKDPQTRQWIQIDPRSISAKRVVVVTDNSQAEPQRAIKEFTGFELDAGGRIVAEQDVIARQVRAQGWHVIDSQGKTVQFLGSKDNPMLLPVPRQPPAAEAAEAEEPAAG